MKKPLNFFSVAFFIDINHVPGFEKLYWYLLLKKELFDVSPFTLKKKEPEYFFINLEAAFLFKIIAGKYLLGFGQFRLHFQDLTGFENLLSLSDKQLYIFQKFSSIKHFETEPEKFIIITTSQSKKN